MLVIAVVHWIPTAPQGLTLTQLSAVTLFKTSGAREEKNTNNFMDLLQVQTISFHEI